MFLGIDDDSGTVTGPRDDGEPCERKGLSGFFRLAVEQSVSMVKLNLLFLLGCIPVVTVPLSLFAMNCVMRRIVRGDPVRCFQDYWKTVRRGWRKGYLVFLLTVPPLGCAGFGMWFYFDRASKNLLFFAPFAVCSTVFLATLLSSGYLYGLLEEGPCAKETVRVAVFLGITKPLRAVLAALSYAGLPALAAMLFPMSGLYIVLLGFSFPCLLGNFYLRTVLKQYEAEREGE